MSLKVKLISAITLFMLMLAVLIVGVLASTQTINLEGSISFAISDPTLYVKDARLKADNTLSGQGQTMDNFVPGFVNGQFNLDLGSINNTTGSFTIYLDIINTSTTLYLATGSGSITNAIYQASGSIPGDGVPVSEVATYEGISGTIEVTVTITASLDSEVVVNLDGIVITLEKYSASISVASSDEVYGVASGAGVYTSGDTVNLQASFVGPDAEFLGWRADSVDGELVSTLANYSFTFTENSPTSYYAIFGSIDSSSLTYTTDAPVAGEARVESCASGVDNLVIPSQIYISGVPYTVTELRDSSITVLGGLFRANRYNLFSVTIPQTLKKIGSYVFNDCENLTLLNMFEDTQLETIATNAFADCSSLISFNIPSTVTSIGDGAFYNCSRLSETIVIPSGVTIIEEDTFYGSAITGLIFEGSVTSIGDTAFANCSSLSGDLILPEGLVSVGQRAFQYCTSLNSIYIPSTLTNIYIDTSSVYGSFTFCHGLTSFDVSPSNPSYTSVDGVLFDKNVTTLLFYPLGNPRTSYVIPSTVETLTAYSFAHYQYLNNLTIPSSVKSIGSDALSGDGYYINGVYQDVGPITAIWIDSEYVYTNATSDTACGKLLGNIEAGDTVYALATLVNTYTNTYLNDGTTYSRSAEPNSSGYYVYTRL